MPLGKGKKVIDPFSTKEYQKRSSKKRELGRTLSTNSLATIWDGISNFRHSIFFAKEKNQKSWIEKTFYKRDCIKFIKSARDAGRCCCGRPASWHTAEVKPGSTESSTPIERWHPYTHTETLPTDAYGTLEFQGAPHPSKAQYVRLSSFDTKAENVLQLLTRHWGLELPKLLITVQGGILNFDLQPKLKRVFRKGLLKAAKTTGAWIITGGTSTGVTRHVGDAISDRATKLKNKVVAIGIAPWGIVENKEELIGKDVVVPYHCVSSPKSNYAVLNSNHSYFLLVDNGTVGKYGGEIIFRKRLERFIAQQKISITSGVQGRGVPVICVVLEGGANTIRSVLEYVTDKPPVPVVVCDGSGRAADLLAFTHKYAQEDGTMVESLRDQLILTIQKTFQYSPEQAEKLFLELMLCVKKRELITVFRMGEGAQDIDLAILTALLKGTNASAPDQLSLALTWDRVDIARSHIFTYGQEWPEGSLEQAMMDALINDRVDFVKLLLENGVSMHTFLTIPRLEELYNTRQGPANTLRYLIRDVRKHVVSTYNYTLIDIGMVIEHLMGGAFRSTYCRKRFRQKYNALRRNNTAGNLHSIVIDLPLMIDTKEAQELFPYPFHDLMIWAVLMKRQKMALFMWQHGEEAMAKALVACKLYKSMAHEADEDNLEVDISEQFLNDGKEFEKLALELLEHCYKIDDDYTQQLLTYELKNFSDQTCLSLAVDAMHQDFVAHTCCQTLINDLWMGGLRMRKNSSLKVIVGIFIPPYAMALEFKTKEELQLMPQTMEEHLEELEDDDSDTEDLSFSSLDDDNVHEYPSIYTISDSQSATQLSINGHSNGKLKQALNNHKSMYCDDMNMDSTQIKGQENGSCLVDTSSTMDYSHMQNKKKKSPLRLGKKIYEFYNAPIVKFWFYTLTYFAFLAAYTFVVLVKTYPQPTWPEIFLMTYVFSLAIEKFRQIVASEPVKISLKLRVFFSQYWNIWDLVAILMFSTAVGLRMYNETRQAARIIYTLNIVFFYIRILEILSVNQYLGPYVKIIGKLLRDMSYFLIIMLLVVMSFGIIRQAVHFQNEEPSWFLVRNMFYYPYWMIYGELFADEIDTCTDPIRHPEGCVYGSWVAPFCMFVFLLISNILLVNLLIARFNATFIRNNAKSREIWKFQRYQLIVNYELRPILPPPFTFISHIYLTFKYIIRRCKGKRDFFDNGLKLFLSPDDKEKLHDFEEECVEDYFRYKDYKFQSSSDERIRVINERVENMTMRMDDINQKENSIKLSLQTMDYRMSKLEDVALQTNDTLSVLRTYMARSVRHFSGASFGSQMHEPSLESQDSIIENDMVMYESDSSPSKETDLEASDTTTPSFTLGTDSPTNTSVETNSTMRSIPSPLLVHTKKPLKEEQLGKVTDFSKQQKPPSKRKLLDQGLLKSQKLMPLQESSPVQEFNEGISLTQRRHVSTELSVNIELANGGATSAPAATHASEVEKNTNQSSLYSTASISSDTQTSTGLPSGGIDSFANSDMQMRISPGSSRPPSSPRISITSAVYGQSKNAFLAPTSVSQMTPILTSISSEYTTITDEIDTSCVVDKSPPGSPSSSGTFFGEGTSDMEKKRKQSDVVTVENVRLKNAEELQHRKMERLIQHRLRQISLDESDCISDIAKLVVSDMNQQEENHSGQEEEEEENSEDMNGSMESLVINQATVTSEVIEIKIRRPSQDIEPAKE
ncbi:transient receptor potential cation channel subfamily M member 1-like isoform X1 [Crassostrea angulata]|uniref:transient receptor potential cation channel subfamily M member 1-like isoform X1 n=1 Tax=Magallana angulata TaxID=2784310 RepID=UPI0022B10E30|nr:transient receptor potential cation channel subfamily M member 1-like isoform X1 [Crassostrea angulata]